jgi:hypothetical protein
MPLIKCEGAKCNDGWSAADWERFLSGRMDPTLVWRRVTEQLRNTQHQIISQNQAECLDCGHIRNYGAPAKERLRKKKSRKETVAA